LEEITSAGFILALLGTGIGVGLAQGLLGLGGAFIMIPLLVFLFDRQDIPIETALPLAFGPCLAVVFTTAISSAWAHHREGHVWWRAAVILGLSGVLGAALGSTLTSQVIDAEVMKGAFGGMTLVAGATMLFSRKAEDERDPQDRPLVWAIWGLPAGFIVGLIAIGGGVVLVPIMTMALGFGMHRAVGTSTGTMLFTTSSGAVAYMINGLGAQDLPSYSVGYINVIAFSCLVATSLVAAQVGARIGHKTSEWILRALFVLTMFYLGLRMIGLFEGLGLPV
jgi:uncharacterized membrane protein YfcA